MKLKNKEKDDRKEEEEISIIAVFGIAILEKGAQLISGNLLNSKKRMKEKIMFRIDYE